MNIISFSLFGSHQKYTVGAIRNAELAAKLYPGWECQFWIGRDVPIAACLQLHELAQIRLIPEWCPPLMGRFLAADDPQAQRVIVRDADSRLSEREVECVHAWVQSDKCLHVMRDHPAHQLIPAGMWGIQVRRDNWQMPRMDGLIQAWLEKHRDQVNDVYQRDQDFLAQAIWPWAQQSALQHDSVAGRRPQLGAVPFPSPRKNHPRFVGEVWEIDPQTGNEFPRERDWENCPKE